MPRCECALSTPREIASFLTLQRSSLINTLFILCRLREQAGLSASCHDVLIAKEKIELMRDLFRGALRAPYHFCKPTMKS